MRIVQWCTKAYVCPWEERYGRVVGAEAGGGLGVGYLVMIGGTMMSMGMGAQMPNHHLELSIMSSVTHTLVTKAMVSITIYTSPGTLVAHVPVAEMRGVTNGPSDTHFGNNVFMKNGSYRVAVLVNSTPATFKITLGGSTMAKM